MADRLGWVRSTGPAGLPPMVQRTPLQPRSPETRSYQFLVLLGRPAWAYRVELTAAALLVTAWSLLDRVLPGVLAVVVVVAGVAGLRSVPVVRRHARSARVRARGYCGGYKARSALVVARRLGERLIRRRSIRCHERTPGTSSNDGSVRLA
jgi:hypothetical protein